MRDMTGGSNTMGAALPTMLIEAGFAEIEVNLFQYASLCLAPVSAALPGRSA